MNMSKSQAPRANAGGRVNFKVEQPASHKRAADRTVDGWDAADAIAEWSDLGALRPASSSQSWPADHRHSDDADEWLSNLPALHGELDEAAP
jgi:predicted RNA-binding Zn ribbon-like protein